MYAFRLLDKAKYNYNTTKQEALAMVFVLHKFKHCLLGNNTTRKCGCSSLVPVH